MLNYTNEAGNWGAWASWGTCGTTCGGGTQIRSRLCNNPAPSNGGAACSGSGSETQACNNQTCPVGKNIICQIFKFNILIIQSKQLSLKKYIFIQCCKINNKYLQNLCEAKDFIHLSNEMKFC